MADETNQPDPSSRSEPTPSTGPATQTGPAPTGTQAAAAPAEPGIGEPPESVETLKAQIADLTDRLLRAHAEMDNIRKRAERDRDETAKYAITRFARDVVTVADNFERAVQAVPEGAAEQDPALKSLVEGVSMTEREFLNVLERFGVKRITPKGEMFNPHHHQAMMEMQNLDVAPGTILDVFQPGYMIEDRVLRPAMVAVAKGGAKPAKSSASSSAGVRDEANDNSPSDASPIGDDTG